MNKIPTGRFHGMDITFFKISCHVHLSKRLLSIKLFFPRICVHCRTMSSKSRLNFNFSIFQIKPYLSYQLLLERIVHHKALISLEPPFVEWITWNIILHQCLINTSFLIITIRTPQHLFFQIAPWYSTL